MITVQFCNNASCNDVPCLQYTSASAPSSLLYICGILYTLGHAAAAGGMLSLAHDYRVMQKDRGWMFLNEIDLGLLFTEGMLSLIRSKTPTPSIFRDFVIFGNRYSGSAAFEAGLVDRVCETGASLDVALDMAEEKIKAKDIPKEKLGLMKTDVYKDVVAKLEMPVTLTEAKL
eukprot:m.102064 g.102064  ORF g.102064 m.102064 type:complete len:173 (+) comp37153_c0_seq1:240-758(+)